MADIRQSTDFLDDFQRANENPLSHGGDWGKTDSGPWPTAMVLETLHATHASGIGTGNMSWIPLSLDGDDAEAWGIATGGNASGIAWGIGLFSSIGGTNQAEGYRFREEVGSGGGATRLYRYLNGSPTTIASSGSSPPTGDPGLLLIRRNGNDVEGWHSGDSGANWTLYVSATDTTYTTGLHPSIGVTDNSASQILGWSAFGGGPGPPNRPQIYRWITN